MLLISIVGFGYAQWNDTLTVVSYMQGGTESMEITNCTITYYNGYGDYIISWDEDTVYFEDTNLFPGWELRLNLTIHNDGTIPLVLRYEISYSWDEGITWIPAPDPSILYDEFRIDYTDGLYNATGHLWDPTQYLWPCETVYKIEQLLFDAQDRSDLQGKTFTIKVEIIGSPPPP